MRYYVINLPAIQKLPVIDRFRLIYRLADSGEDTLYPREAPSGLLHICGIIANYGPIIELPDHYYQHVALRYRATSKTVQSVWKAAQRFHDEWNVTGSTVAKRDYELLAAVFIELKPE